ncbi:MAG: hypothetical protein AVDCRST_MAG95-3713 [uncultured Adhaeribacter sp.]|uniref:Uncharacterized protein n=1 Tax=uncultured Adhaeribacter sp. TaxID=448109 RepID=A0A6J4JT43_9BACT|nr:MAG: hypothetical protein AVDCRST_MAG95-3713 [uncultured Adhaeribacter sp.]
MNMFAAKFLVALMLVKPMGQQGIFDTASL